MCVCVSVGIKVERKIEMREEKLFFPLFRHSSVPFVTFMPFGIIIKAHARTLTIVSSNVANKYTYTSCPQIHIRTHNHTLTHTLNE